jgi:hypothetical protein
VAAIGATNTAVFIVDFHGFLASGTLVGHLLGLQALPDRPKDRTPNGGMGYITASCKGIAALGAVPDGSVCSSNPVPSALGAVIKCPGLLLHISY